MDSDDDSLNVPNGSRSSNGANHWDGHPPQQRQPARLERRLRRRRLRDQTLTRSHSEATSRLLDQSERNSSQSDSASCQRLHDSGMQEDSHTPPPLRGSLVALLREQRIPWIEQAGRDQSGDERARRSSEDDEISSLLQSHRNSSDSSTASPLQNQDQDMDMEDAEASRSSSPAPLPVTTRQQKVRAAKALTTAAATGGKRSRYLREVDRRSIIHRIDRGEKQAALAKEFGVTRAAICHINKSRVEILTRSTRADVHSGARHPKRSLYASSKATVSAPPPASASAASAAPPSSASSKAPQSAATTRENQPSVLEVRSQAMAVLVTTLRKRETPSREFQICTDRAFRLLLEKAMARVAMKVVEIVTPNDFVCEGVSAVKPSCGISISEDGFALLQVFRCIQPSSPSGYITLNATAIHEGVSSEPTLQKVCIPPDLRTYDVFLMEATCATGVGACVAIQALLDFGAQEESIHFVCLLASAFAVSEICSRFPAVHIVTGAVDPEVNDADAICPGFGSFSERYYNATVVHHTSLGANADL